MFFLSPPCGNRLHYLIVKKIMATARLSRAFIRRLDNFRRLPQYSSPQLLKYNNINSLNECSYRFFSTSHLKYEQQQVKREEIQG